MRNIRLFQTIVVLGIANSTVFGFLSGCGPRGTGNNGSGMGLDSGIDAEKDAGNIQDSGTDWGSCASSQPVCLRAACLSAAVAQRQATCALKGSFPVKMQSIQSCESSVRDCSAEGLQLLTASLDCVDRVLIQVDDPCSLEFSGGLYNCHYPNTGPNRCAVK